MDQGSSFFDMTVADSPEDDVPREVLRRRRRSRRRGQDSHGAEDTRRLVLVQSQQSPAVPAPRPFDREHDNPGFEEDTETVDGVSVGDDEGGFAATPVEVPPMIERPVRGLQGAFASLDGVNLKDRFKFRACVMRTVPYVMKGAFRLGLRAALEEVLAGFTQRSDVRMARGWKLFMLLPRMMLHRPPRGGGVPRKKLEERVQLFQNGQWSQLLERSLSNDEQAHHVSSRRRRHQTDSVEKRAERARNLVHLGELSAARIALEGAQVAPGTLATLRELTNPERRPPRPRQQLSEEVIQSTPSVGFELDESQFLVCLRTARRGAAGSPSGMTTDHLQPMSDNEHDSELLSQAASILAQGTIPGEVLDGLRLGRLTALRKPDGGVRGIVVGDVMRRLVARTLAKQVAKKAEEATAPFQYVLTTKAGCGCVAHILQTITDLDNRATVVSIDGVGGVRSDLQERNDGGVAQDQARRSDPPLCTVLLRKPVNVSVGG